MRLNLLNIVVICLFICLEKSASAQTLDSLIELVAQNNPEIKSLRSNYEAQLQQVDQVGQLPNPNLGFGIPVLRPETRLGPQFIMASASQMFPWFGTLSSKEDVVIKFSEAKFEQINKLKLELYYQLKEQYFKLIFLSGKSKLIENMLELFQVLESISLSKVESGQTTTADVLRIQLVIQQLKQQLEVIENDRKSLSVAINQKTNQPLDVLVTPTDSFDLVIPFEFNQQELEDKIKNEHPAILMLNYQIEASQQRQIVNKKLNSPMIGLGLDYSLVGERTDANPLDNGRDILVPKIMLSLPLYRKSYTAKNQEEDFIQEGLNYSKEDMQKKLISQLLIYKLKYDNAILEIQLHQEQINTTELAIEILLANYSSTGKGFDDLLQMENQILEHEIGLVHGQLQMYLAVAGMERLTDY